MDTRNLTDISPATLAALAKFATDAVKATRDDLPPGKHTVDTILTLTLDGTVTVSADGDKVPTCAIPLLPALALMVKRMGLQRDAAMEVLRCVMTEAISLGKDATTELLAETGVADMEEQIKTKVLAALPRTPVKGRVTVKGKASIPA